MECRADFPVRSAPSWRNGCPTAHLGGFTLVEAMVILALLAVLLATAVPGFARTLSAHRAAVATNDLIHAFAFARGEALKRNRRVYLAPLSGRWHDGWVVFIDRNDNRVFDPPDSTAGDELIARHAALPASIALVNPSNPTRESFTDVGSPQRTYVLFDGSGFPRQRNGALHIGSVAVIDRTGPASTIRTICLAAYGRIRVVVDRVGCS